MPPRVCTMSLESPAGISHRVEVEAETLYEAAGKGFGGLKRMAGFEGLGLGSRLEIQVREPSTHHWLSVQQLHRWMDGVTTSPAGGLAAAKEQQQLGS